ncbi:hypothetical protein [Zooshikella harenae]|uniref:Uncharacterized protein n=1 Tax=Zooshikella harenae TaxID=2827238 RepID=A0ABS5Z8U7_9GAMM|nr:hypothetical protein [Zooshikella harenae]MBU2710464.1 hypothetical protein [Zooshikella harenae]
MLDKSITKSAAHFASAFCVLNQPFSEALLTLSFLYLLLVNFKNTTGLVCGEGESCRRNRKGPNYLQGANTEVTYDKLFGFSLCVLQEVILLVELSGNSRILKPIF